MQRRSNRSFPFFPLPPPPTPPLPPYNHAAPAPACTTNANLRALRWTVNDGALSARRDSSGNVRLSFVGPINFPKRLCVDFSAAPAYGGCSDLESMCRDRACAFTIQTATFTARDGGLGQCCIRGAASLGACSSAFPRQQLFCFVLLLVVNLPAFAALLLCGSRKRHVAGCVFRGGPPTSKRPFASTSLPQLKLSPSPQPSHLTNRSPSPSPTPPPFPLLPAVNCNDNNGECSSFATCSISELSGNRTCTCNSGYSGDGFTCTQTRSCRVRNGGCSRYATCSSGAEPGQVTCTCRRGFSGDGVTCADVNECLRNNGGCDVNALCINRVGSFSCRCKAGYTGTGKRCDDIDECATNNGGCDTNATCTNTVGSRTCACDDGFIGSGTVCTGERCDPRRAAPQRAR